MSDGRCQVHMVPVIKKSALSKKYEREKNVVVESLPGPTTTTPVFRPKNNEVDNEPCVLPPELLQKLRDSKNFLILNSSSEIDDELLEGKEELIFTYSPIHKTFDTPKIFENVDNLSNKNTIKPTHIPYAMSKFKISEKNIGQGNDDDDGHANDENERNQENEVKIHQRAENEVDKFKTDIKNQKKIVNIMDIIKQNKKSKADEPDSVSAETKKELNKYLEYGTKSKKILNIIKIIKQNKEHDGVENNNKPNININIFKMMKTAADENDTGKKVKQSKSDINKIKTTKDLYTDSIEKKIELDNNKYNLEKAKSSETVENKKNKLSSKSVERNIEYNNNKYQLQNTKNKQEKISKTDVDETPSSEIEIKDNKNTKRDKIKLLETNIHSDSDSIENKNKESKKLQKEKIKYHESDSTEKLSSDNDNLNVMNDDYRESSESDEISNREKITYEKNKDEDSDDDFDHSYEIEIKPTDKTDKIHHEMTYKTTTLRPKKKQKEDYMYMQGPHTLGKNYISYEVKYKRSGLKSSTTVRRSLSNKNNIIKNINNRRLSSDFKNYWSVPFNILTRKRHEKVTSS